LSANAAFEGDLDDDERFGQSRAVVVDWRDKDEEVVCWSVGH
jgi:hypothetical protein